MFIIIPLLVIIAVIFAVDHIYFSNVVPKDAPPTKEMHRSYNDVNASKAYLDRYIKK